MAQSRTKSSQQSSATSKRRTGSSGNGSGPKSGSAAKSRSRASSNRSRARSQSKGAIATAREAVSDGAQSAGQAVETAASKAKIPAAAGGAALAGLVGGVAIAARGGRRKVLGVPIPGTRRPLVTIKTPRRKAGTKDLVTAGRQMAELATEVRLAREQLNSGRRRSPIEVVLDGLTARRGRQG